MAWQRLIRFKDSKGSILYGQPSIKTSDEFSTKLASKSLFAKVLKGSELFNLQSTGGEEVKVEEVLGPLTPEDVPMVICVGLNYMKHIKEGGRTPPPYPSIFIKGASSICGASEDIEIPKIAQDQLDYEGELTVVIGKTGKDIPRDRVHDYIAGYTIGNDVTTRKWQRDPAFAGGVPQWCFAKGFDKFAPIGPMLVSPSLVGAADTLQLQTRVNGELRQDTNTDDLLFPVKDIISFISQGTTLKKGTVIMTGTPSGVAMGMKSPKWLKDGDVVEISIEQLGVLRNKMVFQ